MSYNDELNSNNTELNEILNTINELPTAEEGGESGSGGATLYRHNIEIVLVMDEGQTELRVCFTTYSKHNSPLTQPTDIIQYCKSTNMLCASGASLDPMYGYLFRLVYGIRIIEDTNSAYGGYFDVHLGMFGQYTDGESSIMRINDTHFSSNSVIIYDDVVEVS